MVEILLALSVPVWALVMFIKSGIVWAGLFDNATEKAQTLILQLIALIVGIAAAIIWKINAFAEVPVAIDVPEWALWVATGAFASGGSALIHLIGAFLAMRGGVLLNSPVKAPSVDAQGVAQPTRQSYAPFL